jgi:ankyrin repeat protein
VRLAAGADPDHATADGMTPDMIAGAREHEDIVKLLQAAPRKKK